MRPEAHPIASVIIPTRDRLSFLQDAVKSVLKQSLQPCEAVVVDDASSDGTTEWLRMQDPSQVVTVRLDEHGERAVARNRGLERARGDFVLFLDDDDRLTISALQHLHAALRARSDRVGAVGARVLFNEDGHRRMLPHPRRRLEREVWLDLLAGWMSPPGTVLWRADVVRAVGGWNEAMVYSGDRELFLRVSRKGPVVLVPNVVLEKRAHGDQWRGPREERHRWMQAYIDTLPPVDQWPARAAFAACRLWNDARIANGNLRAREAVMLYARAIRAAPYLLGSPLLRGTILGGMAKAALGMLFGNRAVLRARRVKREFLRGLSRDVEEVKRDANGR